MIIALLCVNAMISHVKRECLYTERKKKTYVADKVFPNNWEKLPKYNKVLWNILSSAVALERKLYEIMRSTELFWAQHVIDSIFERPARPLFSLFHWTAWSLHFGRAEDVFDWLQKVSPSQTDRYANYPEPPSTYSVVGSLLLQWYIRKGDSKSISTRNIGDRCQLGSFNSNL